MNGAFAPRVGQGVQFRALNWPRFYLRHHQFEVRLHEEPMFGIDPERPPTYQTRENELFWADVTFRVAPGLSDPSWVSFESVNYPGHFIRHSHYKLRLVPYDVPQTATAQGAWRFCDKCYVLFFDGYPDKKTCPVGDRKHHAAGYLFVISHDIAGQWDNQTEWRFCVKCQAMHYNGYPNPGRCAGGGLHEPAGFHFVLPYYAAQPGPIADRWQQLNGLSGPLGAAYARAEPPHRRGLLRTRSRPVPGLRKRQPRLDTQPRPSHDRGPVPPKRASHPRLGANRPLQLRQVHRPLVPHQRSSWGSPATGRSASTGGWSRSTSSLRRGRDWSARSPGRRPDEHRRSRTWSTPITAIGARASYLRI